MTFIVHVYVQRVFYVLYTAFCARVAQYTVLWFMC